MLPRHRFSPSSTEFQAALRLVFKKQEQTWGLSRTDQALRAAARPVRARCKTGPQGVESEQVLEENGHMLGSESRMGNERRKAIYAVRTVGTSHGGKWCCPINYHTSQPGTDLPQSSSKTWRGILEINMHTCSENKTKIWCKTICQQGLVKQSYLKSLQDPTQKAAEHTIISRRNAVLQCNKQENDTPNPGSKISKNKHILTEGALE